MLRGESSGRPDDNIESLKKRYVSNRILNAFPLVIHWVLKKCCLWIVFNFPFLNDFHYMYVAYKAQYYFSIQSLIQTFSCSSWISPAYSCSAKLLLDRRQFIFLRQCAFCGSKNGLCVRELFFGFCVLLRGIHAFHASMAFFAA